MAIFRTGVGLGHLNISNWLVVTFSIIKSDYAANFFLT